MVHCYRLWVRHCCWPKPVMMMDRFGPFVLLAVMFGFVAFLIALMSPIELAQRLQGAFFLGWGMYLYIGFLDCGDYWSSQVARMTKKRRFVYIALSSPFFFMFLAMTIFRCLS